MLPWVGISVFCAACGRLNFDPIDDALPPDDGSLLATAPSCCATSSPAIRAPRTRTSTSLPPRSSITSPRPCRGGAPSNTPLHFDHAVRSDEDPRRLDDRVGNAAGSCLPRPAPAQRHHRDRDRVGEHDHWGHVRSAPRCTGRRPARCADHAAHVLGRPGDDRRHPECRRLVSRSDEERGLAAVVQPGRLAAF